MKTFAIVAASVGLALSASPALAGDATVQTKEVSTAGIDLATSEGQALLDQRIEIAARQVCGVNSVQTGTRLKPATSRACVIRAVASAKKQVALARNESKRGG